MITTKILTLKDGRKITMIDSQREFLPTRKVQREATQKSLLFELDRHYTQAHCLRENR